MNVFLYTFSIVLSFVVCSAQERPCECVKTAMNCIAKGKKSFGPKDYCPGKITQVILYQNQISSLATNAFSGLKDLELIVLDKNNLTSLPRGIFKDLKKLKQLSLQDNNLNNLPEDIFLGLEKIELIALEKNKFTQLPSRLFSTIRSIKYIGLGYNSIRNIPANLFSGLKNLQIIDLSQNGINILPPNLFKDVDDLEELHLSLNKLKTITAKDLSGIEFVENLWLDFNEMASLPKYDSSWPKIDTAALYGNKIEDVSEAELRSWLESGDRVRTLNLASSMPLKNPASLRWILGASGVTTTVASSNCQCGSITKGKTRVNMCLSAACGGPNQPANWLEAVRAATRGTGSGGSNAGGRERERSSLIRPGRFAY